MTSQGFSRVDDRGRTTRSRPAGPDITAQICDIPSVSGSERAIADAIEAALRPLQHLHVDRNGDTIVARTEVGRAERVVVAGHLDTVPIAKNLPTRRDGDMLWGRGTVDMKGGVAVALRLAAHVDRPIRDVTYVFYDHEEVEAARSGLARVVRENAEWLAGDFAVLMEPTAAQVEAGATAPCGPRSRSADVRRTAPGPGWAATPCMRQGSPRPVAVLPTR